MIQTFILAKNEAANIRKCCVHFSGRQTTVTVLDSGSVDATAQIAASVAGTVVVPFVYTNHAEAHNDITLKHTSPDAWALILDADMEVSDELWGELSELARTGAESVVEAPVAMYIEGREMRHGSLYPPKPILFRGGRAHVVLRGHAERLADGSVAVRTQHSLVHNDLKEYGEFLKSQVRYAEVALDHDTTARPAAARRRVDRPSLSARIRRSTPLMAFVIPFYSLVVAGGWRAGRAGVVYALDRAIAELVQFRQAVARRLHKR